MSALRKSSSTRLKEIGKLVAVRDENTRAFVDRWRRMHGGRRPLVAVRLRFVMWAAEGQPTQRFVWELCRWPTGDSFRWMFVCWLLDEVGMWWKAFPSLRAGLAYFRQPPSVVMARKPAPVEESLRAS